MRNDRTNIENLIIHRYMWTAENVQNGKSTIIINFKKLKGCSFSQYAIGQLRLKNPIIELLYGKFNVVDLNPKLEKHLGTFFVSQVSTHCYFYGLDMGLDRPKAGVYKLFYGF